MGLKILHSADWHLDAPFASFSEEQRAFLRREQRKLPGKMAELCQRENCDLVLLAGDIFDGAASRETICAVRQALEDCGVPVLVTPGNHDFYEVGSPWQKEDWPENVTVFRGNLEEKWLPVPNCRIYGAGYRSMDCGPMLEGFRAKEGEEYRIGVVHGDPVTAHSPYCPVTAAQVAASGLHYLALGHVHSHGFFRAGDTLCAWPGCPMGRGWDETGEKGALIVTIEETAAATFVPLTGPRFYDLEADVSPGAEKTLDSLLPAAGSSDFFRLTLTGRSQVDLQMLQQRCSRIPNLVLRDRTMPERDLWADVESDTFRGVYFRLLQQQAQKDPRALLAAELSQRILEGREVTLP